MITETYADRSLRDLCYILIKKEDRPAVVVIVLDTNTDIWYNVFGNTMYVSTGLSKMLHDALGVSKSLKFKTIKGIPVEYRDFR